MFFKSKQCVFLLNTDEDNALARCELVSIITLLFLKAGSEIQEIRVERLRGSLKRKGLFVTTAVY